MSNLHNMDETLDWLQAWREHYRNQPLALARRLRKTADEQSSLLTGALGYLATDEQKRCTAVLQTAAHEAEVAAGGLRGPEAILIAAAEVQYLRASCGDGRG